VDDDLRKAWAEYLGSLPWDYFLTVTFREPLPPHRGEAVLNSIERTLVSWQNPAMLFLGMELHVSRFLHLHGLYLTQRRWPNLGYMPEDSTVSIWKALFKVFGRTRVELIRSPAEAAMYVSKYCVKDLEAYRIWYPEG